MSSSPKEKDCKEEAALIDEEEHSVRGQKWCETIECADDADVNADGTVSDVAGVSCPRGFQVCS